MRSEKEISLVDIPLPGTALLERQIIADAISNPDTIGEVSPIIFPDYFTSDERRMIWNTVVDMYNRRETIDMPSVWQRCGKVYITEIQTQNVVASTALGFLDHARLLQIANTKKRAYYAALTIVQQSASVGTSEDDIFSAADELSRKIKGDYAPAGESPLRSVLDTVAAETEEEEKAAQKGSTIRVPTRIPTLDRNLLGGFRGGQLIVLAARPSVGKTALMLQFAKSAAEHNTNTLIFSLEMTKPELGRRLILSTGCISTEQMTGGNVNWGGFEAAVGAIERLPIFINDDSRTLQGIISRMTVAVNQGRCGIAMIDYLGQIQFDPSSRLSLAQQISFATTELTQTAQRLNIPIVVLVQLNRKSAEEKRPPELYDLRDSGSIEQDADVVLMLEQRWKGNGKENGETPFVDVWVRKNRGYKKDFKITTLPNSSYTHFTEVVGESSGIQEEYHRQTTNDDPF